jgi:hypothetical protein
MCKILGLHRIENYGLKCNFCRGLGHTKECCLKKKDPYMSGAATNYLEVVVDGEEAIRNYLDKICGSSQDLFSHTRVPKCRVHVDAFARGQEEAHERDLA